MTSAEIIDQLSRLGSESTKKIQRRQGAKGPVPEARRRLVQKEAAAARADAPYRT